MLIKILNVDIETVTKGRSSYNIAEVLYDFNGDKKTFKLFSFVNPNVYKVVAGAKNGDQLNITTGKNDKGYTTWENAEASTGVEKGEVPAAAKSNTYGGGTRDFETKDEREARQRYIIRQSSLSNAINVLTTGAKTPPDVKAILSLSDEFVNYVFETADIFDASFPSDIEQE